MEFIEGTRGIYRPIRELFDSLIYEETLEACWHVSTYRSTIALMAELLRLQQQNQFPSEVTAEDMTELLVEQNNHSLRVMLWKFQVETSVEADLKSLLKLVWAVNTSMKMRDVEFEARRSIPTQFIHPKILSQAEQCARSLTEQQQKAHGSKRLGPLEVVMEVVPKVLQGFWPPPPNPSFDMPSKPLGKMAVGVTKAVEDRVSAALLTTLHQVTFSRSTRDDMVLSIQETVRQAEDVLVEKLSCFSAQILNAIADVTAREICALFQTSIEPPVDVSCTQSAESISAAEVTSQGGRQHFWDGFRKILCCCVLPQDTD